MTKGARAARVVSADEAASVVRSGDYLDYGAVLSQPDVFDRALAARVGAVTNLKLRSCISVRPRAVLEADPKGAHVFLLSLHFSAYDRKKHDSGQAHYLPVNLGEIPDYYRRFIPPVDVVILKARPADENGVFNLSASNLWHRAVIERARTVIVEVSPELPHVYGEGAGIHASEVDYVIDGSGIAPPELPNPPPSDVDEAVAKHIAAHVEDGACLQIGIGAMPNSACSLLIESGVKDLGVHTEMMTDGIAELYRAGRITGTRKAIDRGKIVYTFALGSKALYDTLDRNPDMLCNPVEYTNLPRTIQMNDNVVSINSTTQVDLQGQCASESDGHRHLTGTGGQLQFVRGAYASKGGKSFICLPSSYEKNGQRKSRIVLAHPNGTIVTTPRTDTMYVVTEWGVASLKGKSVPERARALIAIAHPDFREELERQAYAHRLIPRGFTF